MNLQPATESWTEDVFSVYEFAFRFRTSLVDARYCLTRLYREFLSSDTTKPAVEAVLEKDHGEGFCWMVGDKGGTTSQLSVALLNLESSLCEAVIRSQRRSIAVHGAALISNSATALIVGPSGAGKSTLSMAMARRGFTVASDDVTLVEASTLNVLPIPRCLHLDDGSLALLRADGLQFPRVPAVASFLVPNDFGVTATVPRRAHVLVLISAPREERPKMIRVSQAEMAARLLQETGQGPFTDGETVAVLSRLAAEATCYKLIPGPLTPTADGLAELIFGQDTSNGRAAMI